MKFFKRQYCFLPTWQANILFIALIYSLFFLFLHSIVPFLTYKNIIQSNFIVVEGWVPDYVLEAAITEFKRKNCGKIFVVGGPIERGSFLSDYKTWADFGANSLHKMGVAEESIVAIPTPYVIKDRTYSSALELKKKYPKLISFNLIGYGAHSRRTYFLFKGAFGNEYQIGIIPVRDLDFDELKWWESSSGFRTIIDESIAWFYAFVFLLSINV